MRVLPLTLASIGVCASFGVALTAAHDDDPKFLLRMEVETNLGRGWRPAEAGLGQPGTGNGGAFEFDGVTLLSWMTPGDLGISTNCNDVWGYVSPSGREYAVQCTEDNTIFVEVTDPANPVVVDTVDGPDGIWRDAKTYLDHAYVVSETNGIGVQVIDLSTLDSGSVTLVNTINDVGTGKTHNVVINEASGYLYRTGGSGHGLRIYSLANPANPTYVGSWDTRYVHDAQVVNWSDGREIAFCCSGFNGGWDDPGLTIVDVTNKGSISVIAQLYYPSPAYSHQGWLSEDRQHFYLGDELDEDGAIFTRTHVFDVADPDAASYVGLFQNGSQSIGHNMYTHGGLLYQANYRSGLRVFDLGQSATVPPEVAYFDTQPGIDTADFAGTWSVYPYLPSGTILLSDRGEGLFILELDADCDNDGVPDNQEIDCNNNGIPDDCESFADCNSNGVPDECDADCNSNGTPDDCESFSDCDSNGVPDECQADCDSDGTPDACEADCNSNGTPDDCESFSDCNSNGVPDDCEADCDSDGTPDDCEADCNSNGTPDDCESFSDCDSNGVPDECQADCDSDGTPDACEADCNSNGTPDDCESFSDCNSNGTPDDCESLDDCNSNGTPDDCESLDDCNANGTPDECESFSDCDSNGVPDECQADCDSDGTPDACETDCNSNGTPDDCESFSDCNSNGIPDDCEADCDSDGTPDDCETDCNSNGTPDDCESFSDCNSNGIPDECEADCDSDGTPDDCETDCNSNGTPDDCESFSDCDSNGVPDECQADCDSDGTPDACETDCNANGTPDDCETFDDCNSNGVPDECDPDGDGDGTPDDCELGTNYCGPAVPNSAGTSAVIGAEGSTVVADNDLTLIASEMPIFKFGYFLVSGTQAFVPNPGGSQGNLCLGGTIGRYKNDVLTSDVEGAFSLAIDLNSLPAPLLVPVLPGETWNWQAWFRDNNPNQTSNFTDAIAITFE